MFYRRKIILAVLQVFNNELPATRLYKLMLMVTQSQQKPQYDFVPYQYGCYSFSMHADLVAMVKNNSVAEEEGKTIRKTDPKNYFATLQEADKKTILSLHARFKNASTNELIRYTYTNYPYTAINSLVAQELLNTDEWARVQQQRPSANSSCLFTIGYEGVSLEHYLNKLLKNNIKLLVDVRRNALSMKFGFSKSQLIKYCTNLGIEYVHIPELGIDADQRQQLNEQADYDKLFAHYRKNNLPKTLTFQQKIFSLMVDYKRIALTCFEADICQCHRKHLAEAIIKLPGWTHELKHI